MVALLRSLLGLYLLVFLPRDVSAATSLPMQTRPADTRRPKLAARQTPSSTSLELFPTITASSTSPPAEYPTGAPSPVTSSGESHEFLTQTTLQVAEKPIPLAATIGLIMPNPYDKNFVEIPYDLGFVEAVPRPAPTVGGWLRVVSPVLLFPDYTVNVLPESGTADPGSDLAIPPSTGGLCGAVAENYPVKYPYIFHRPGWYMFVLNQTWLQPTITNSTCALPLVSQQSFFATHLVSISPLPTGGSMPRPPTSAYTLWVGISTSLPGSIPLEDHHVGPSEKLGIGLGVTGAILAFVVCIGGLMYVRSRKKAKREVSLRLSWGTGADDQTIAFNRLKPHDQAQFLADNPNHFLNPYRRAGKSGVDGWGRPIPGWRGWGRWGQGSGVTGWGGTGWGGNPAAPGAMAGRGGYGWDQQPQPNAGMEGMRQVYNVVPQQQPIGVAGMGGQQQQPLMVWPTGQQGGYGQAYR